MENVETTPSNFEPSLYAWSAPENDPEGKHQDSRDDDDEDRPRCSLGEDLDYRIPLLMDCPRFSWTTEIM